jgi:glycosyltransferase involved in cell wall biosynthesis
VASPVFAAEEQPVVKVTTIITCMTDAERDFVAEAIESVLAQTVPTSIILCVCDTNRWIDAVLPRGAADLHVLRMPLAPLGTVRNTALAQVQTDAVAFLDGDDAWMRSKVERQVRLLEQHGLDLIGSKHLLIRDDSKPYFFAFAKDIPMPSSWLGRTSVFRERPFSSVHIGEDVQLWHDLESTVRCGIAESYLIRYRVRRGSLSQSTPSMRRKLAYEQRSRVPGLRPVLLGGSYAASVGLSLKQRWRPSDAPTVRVR